MNTVPSVCSVVSSAPQKVAVQQVMISDAAPILASSVTIPETKQKQSHFHISCLLSGRHRTVKVAAMVDSGATVLFLDKKYADRQNMWQIPLEHPITLYNIDGSLNEAGSITHKVRLSLKIGSDEEKFDFFVTSLGPEKVILGLPWLRHRNPAIDWQAGTMRLNSNTNHIPEELEVEVTRINANRMERRSLLHDGVIDSVQDELFCLAGFTYSQQITARATEAKGKRTFEEMVPEHYRDFAKVFSEEESQRLPQHQSWDHTIDFEPGAVTHWKVRTYPMAPPEQEELDKFLAEHLAKRYIEPSTSPMSSPVFFIRKADGRYRLVQDYRRMNKITIKNKTPLPLAADIINRLTGAQYFTKFDVRWGYHNIRIREGDEWKAAFSTNRGLFQPKVMYFGLTNSPATFQSLMNSIFADLIARSEVAVYMDDILIYSSDLEHHRKIVREVLSRLQKYDLYLRPEKCEFEMQEIEYLGMIIRPGEVRMNPGKVAAVRDWTTPTNLREVRAFIGFANFYRRFIKDFASIARPLHDLTKKDTPWQWHSEQQKAFNELKRRFCEEPILKVYDPELPTRVEVDASGFATGGILSQKSHDGLWHPVAYRSQSMSKEERNYPIYDREMLGLIRALEDWRHFVEGISFEVITDHKNMEWWTTMQDLSRRQARWAIFLSRFTFKVTYKKGELMQADALSRFAKDHVSDNDDNRQVQVLGPQYFLAAAHAHFRPEIDSLGDRIRVAVQREAEVIEGLKSIDKTAPKALTDGTAMWEEDDGFVYYRGRLYVPNDRVLRRDVVKSCHDSLTTGHPGKNGTIELVSRYYWWPRMGGFITSYVEGCDKCQRYRKDLHPKALIHPQEVPEGPWQIIGVDLIGPLPVSRGKDAILNIVDHYTKQIHLFPVTTQITVDGVASIYFEQVFPLHGIPKRIISDRGPQFAARSMRALYKRLGIDAGLTTAYHPQANGQVERKNQEVEVYLRLFVDKRQDDWVDLLPTAEFTINSRLNSATGATPFELLYGYTPDFTIPAGRPTGIPTLDKRLQHLQSLRKDAEAALCLSKKRMQTDIEQRRQPYKFNVGDKVWLQAKQIKIHQQSSKLGPKQLGPFEVIEVRSDVDYKLALPPALKVHNVFHVDRLSPYKGNEVNGLTPPPPDPVTIEGEEEYEVDHIRDSKVFGRSLKYLVRWTGYGEGEDTWEPAKNLAHSPDKVSEFHSKNPGVPRKIAALIYASLPWQSPNVYTEANADVGP
jgi:predicted aspartyl protease